MSTHAPPQQRHRVSPSCGPSPQRWPLQANSRAAQQEVSAQSAPPRQSSSKPFEQMRLVSSSVSTQLASSQSARPSQSSSTPFSHAAVPDSSSLQQSGSSGWSIAPSQSLSIP